MLKIFIKTSSISVDSLSVENPADLRHTEVSKCEKTDFKTNKPKENAQNLHQNFTNPFIDSLSVETSAAPRHIKFPYVRKIDFKTIETEK